MANLNETFTGANGTDLTAHTSDSGHSWTVGTGSPGGVAEIQSNQLKSRSGGSPWLYSSCVPASADYSVQADLASGGYTSAIFGRASTSANTYYGIAYRGGGQQYWELFKTVAGSTTQLGTYVGDIPLTNVTIKLEMIGTAIKVYVNGTQRISVTDSSITAAGRAGLQTAGGSTDTIDTMTTTDVSSGTTVTIAQSAMTMTGFVPAELLTQPIGSSSVVMTGQAPTPTMGLPIGTSSLLITGYVPTLNNQLAIAVSSMVVNGFAMSLKQAIMVGLSQLIVDGYGVSERTAVLPDASQMSMAGYAEALASIVPVAFANVSFSGQVPSLNNRVPVTQSDLTITGYSPGLAQPGIVPIGAGAIVITGASPSMQQTMPIGVAQISFSGQIPSVLQGLMIGVAQLAVNGQAPSWKMTLPITQVQMSFTGFGSVIQLTMPIAGGSITLTGFAPTINAGGSVNVAISQAQLTINGLTPSVVGNGLLISVGTAQVTITGQALTLYKFRAARYTDNRPDAALTSTRPDNTKSTTRH